MSTYIVVVVSLIPSPTNISGLFVVPRIKKKSSEKQGRPGVSKHVTFTADGDWIGKAQLLI